MADDDGPNNLIHFPRVGYTAPAEPPAEPPASAPADAPFAAPADTSPATPEAFAPATRTDPMDVIAALPEPGLGTPFTADTEPAAAPATTPATGAAMVPATFRSEGTQPAAPRLGSLSLAAILAVSLAAVRGIHSAVATGRANREQREAVAKTASTAKDRPGGGGSKKQVQPSHEYGRKTLQRGPGGLGGRSGGAGPGRSGRGGSGSYSGSGGRGSGGSTTRSPSGSGGGSRGRRGNSGSGPGRSNSGSGGRGGSGVTPLKRTSQGGGVNLKKNRGPGSSGGLGGPGGSGGGKGPSTSGGGGGRKNRGPRSGGGSGSLGGGTSTNRKRGPSGTGSGTGGSFGGAKKRGPGSGTGTGKTTGPGAKSPGKGTGPGGKTTPGTGKGAGTGSKSGTKQSPRGTTGPSGILRKRPGTTTFGTGPKAKPKGKGSSGAATAALGSKRGGKKGKTNSAKGSVPALKAPDGKSRKGKKVKLTPGIAHGSMAASDSYGCRCRKCRRFDREYGKTMEAARKSAERGRTTFGEAVHETAAKRFKRRRKKMRPPIVTKVKGKKPKKKTGPETKTTKAGSTKPAGAASTGPTVKVPTGAATAPTRRTPWSTAKARARKRARMRTTTVPGGGPSPTLGPAGPTPVAAVAGPVTAPSAAGGGTVPGTGTPRLSPFEAMGMATAGSAPAGPITVERTDSPGVGAPGGTSSTKENSVSDASKTGGLVAASPERDSWIKRWGSGAIADMDAQHATEVTLDDTLDLLEELTQQSFKAHETCLKLAAKARAIRHELDELAADLRSTHNVIGRLTGAAMAKLAESMELLARKADEMSTKSLAAAEVSETTENAMFDAYRPLQQATEDAGLLVPAARIHNEN
ncbi:hypothetical protein [Streptomyces sp. RK75]|uniref:hypothetical protein n=1 Tax=Streptomyces sp. RK75 TaxID=2824895 RepID=UPI001B361307|nr:hypothetical protein [Streptomyces sp. RK75]MBQ0867385.1 hypothetical protein [Streptomyces sp. RK75]